MKRSLLAERIRFLVSILAYHAAVGQAGASRRRLGSERYSAAIGSLAIATNCKTANLSRPGLGLAAARSHLAAKATGADRVEKKRTPEERWRAIAVDMDERGAMLSK